jgi:Zn-dependent metalloprotease
MRKLLFLVISITLSAFVLLPPFVVQGQKDNAKKPDKPTGKIIRSYRDGEGARPDWVEGSRQRSMAFLKSRGEAAGVRDPEAELKLVAAKQDDLGQTHVRFEQVYKGVPVYGRQIITHLDGANGRGVTGVLFNGAREVDTTPKLSASQAIAAARASFKNNDGSAKEPEAKLVILPPRDDSSDAMLTYQVQIFVEYPNKAPERREYFVDADSGNIVWYFNSLPTGTGYSLYSGAQYIPTTGSWGNFYMQSPTHSNSYTWDYTYGTIFTDYDDVWGDSTEWNRQTAGVDAHFAMTRAWDYFQTRHARCGMNNGCAQTFSAVHYGTNLANAFYSGGGMYFGDGDAYSSPWVSVDVVAHEFTHGVTEYAAGLQYVDESGAANESFSDIFGTAVEFATGINPDYSIAEDVTYPGIRSMADPSIFGHPDHYSERVYIGTGYDNGGVHFNSGIQNKAFYLLAEGGTHPQSGISVSGIGREAAERIFYRALEVYLWSSSQFLDVRNACVAAAADIYGTGSAQYNSTQAAWCAVGVGNCAPQGGVNNATFVSQSVPTSMIAGQSYSVSVTMNNSGTTTWTPGVHRLGSQNPENNSTWGGRVDLPYSVAPGQNVTFYFTVTAPPAGTYNFQWRMLEEYVQWFGDYTPNVVVTVTSGGSNCNPDAMQTCLDNGGVWNSTYCRCRYVPTCANGVIACP